MPIATSRPPKPDSDGSADLTGAAADERPSIGFLGLGIMGTAMSSNLIGAGFKVSGFDPSEAASERLEKAGGRSCASAAEVALEADVVITSLPSGRALIEAAEAIAGAARRGRTGLVVVETSTLDIDDKIAARDALHAVGVVLLDCPLSGTGAQAVTKDLSVYSSGPEEAVRRLQPVFGGFSKANYYLGAFGNGMRMKLMANLLVAIHNVSTAEVLLFGKRMGIAPELAVKVLSDGAGGSRMFQVRGPVMASGSWDEATMKVGVWQKDMKLIHAALAATHTPAPLFAATEPIYNAAMAAGHADHDTAAVFDVLVRMCDSVTTPS